MHVIAPPTQVGEDHWPVLSFVRVSTAEHPATFVVIVDCGEGTPEHPYATLEVCVWPGRRTVGEGEYNLTFDQARRSLAQRAGLAPTTATTTVEVVVARDPDAANDYAVFVNGTRRVDATTGPVWVITHDIDLGAAEITPEWDAEQLHRAEGLSPAAARHARDAVLGYVDDTEVDTAPGGDTTAAPPCGGGAA
jgi:hypothetical protein